MEPAAGRPGPALGAVRLPPRAQHTLGLPRMTAVPHSAELAAGQHPPDRSHTRPSRVQAGAQGRSRLMAQTEMGAMHSKWG
jgi:hypothetical protein